MPEKFTGIPAKLSVFEMTMRGEICRGTQQIGVARQICDSLLSAAPE
jgi:hypothetical protein